MELILYSNAQSFMAHKDEIHYLIVMKMNPVILTLTETRLTEKIDR